MGTVNNALLLEKGLRAEFQKAFNNGEDPADVMPMIMTTTSTSDKEKYGWLGESPQLRVWKDERQLSGLNDFSFEIPNVDYEATLKIDRNAQADDQLGAVQMRVRDLAARARTHPRKLFFDQILVGGTELGYDGVPFYSASHPEDPAGVQDNDLAGTSSGPYTAAEFSTDFETARATMRGFKDDQSEPRNEGELDLRVVGSPALEPVVDKILSADLINNTTNTLKGAAKKVISSRLTGETWFLMDSSGTLKPLVLQKRQAINFEFLNKGDRAFMRKEILAGVDKRDGFGFGVWYKSVRTVN